jgi:hypothetical protein
MTAFEAPLATEAPKDTPAKTLYRRTMVAVMALLMAIAAVALVSTNSHIPFPSDRSVLACGDAPGLCPSPPGPDHPGSNPSGSKPHSAPNTWL